MLWLSPILKNTRTANAMTFTHFKNTRTANIFSSNVGKKVSPFWQASNNLLFVDTLCNLTSYHLCTVTCESLVSREFWKIILQFHLSILISRHLNFTFTSWKEWNQNHFNFHFSKSVKAFQISLFSQEKKSEIMHVNYENWLCKTLKYNIYNDYILQNLRIFLILEGFSRIHEKFHFSISILRNFHFTFRKEWIGFSFHFSLFKKSPQIKSPDSLVAWAGPQSHGKYHLKCF